MVSSGKSFGRHKMIEISIKTFLESCKREREIYAFNTFFLVLVLPASSVYWFTPRATCITHFNGIFESDHCIQRYCYSPNKKLVVKQQIRVFERVVQCGVYLRTPTLKPLGERKLEVKLDNKFHHRLKRNHFGDC